MRADGIGLDGKKIAIIAAILIIVVGGIFFAITNGAFRRTVEVDKVDVTDVFAARSVRMTVEGPVVANEEHELYRISVGIDQRSIEAIKGYELTIVGSHALGNNRKAYTDFVYALKRAGFDAERKVSEAAADERGACATGKRYIFEVLDDSRSLRRLWTSSCSNAKGTLDARTSSLKSLFDDQIPDRITHLKPISLR